MRRARDTAAAAAEEEEEEREQEMKAETVFRQESFIRRADDDEDDEVLELDAWKKDGKERKRGLWQMSSFSGLTRRWHYWVCEL